MRRARQLIFWPGMSADIREYVATRDACGTFSHKQPQESLSLHEIPSRAWQRVAADIFTICGRNYLVTVDCYSSFFELDFLIDTLSTTVIAKLKHHFARYGIPDEFISDGGPQFTSDKFKEFAKKWYFKHTVTGPGNSKANGAA